MKEISKIEALVSASGIRFIDFARISFVINDVIWVDGSVHSMLHEYKAGDSLDEFADVLETYSSYKLFEIEEYAEDEESSTGDKTYLLDHADQISKYIADNEYDSDKSNGKVIAYNDNVTYEIILIDGVLDAENSSSVYADDYNRLNMSFVPSDSAYEIITEYTDFDTEYKSIRIYTLDSITNILVDIQSRNDEIDRIMKLIEAQKGA